MRVCDAVCWLSSAAEPVTGKYDSAFPDIGRPAKKLSPTDAALGGRKMSLKTKLPLV